MQYTITVNEDSVWAITAARQAYNAALPATVKDEAQEDVPNPDLIATNDAYIAMVFGRAVQSWAAQYAPVTPAPAPAPVTATALRFIKKWQLRAGMRIDDPTGTLIAAFDSVIASLPAVVKDLWEGSSGIEEGSPFVDMAKGAPMHLTDAQIERMFAKYPTITQAHVAALAAGQIVTL